MYCVFRLSGSGELELKVDDGILHRIVPTPRFQVKSFSLKKALSWFEDGMQVRPDGGRVIVSGEPMTTVDVDSCSSLERWD